MFFFFSSRRRHTSSKRDWSSDVCSSDLFFDTALSRQNAKPVIAELLGTQRRVEEGLQRPLQSIGPLLHRRLAVVGLRQIGRASCRERVSMSVVDVSVEVQLPYGQNTPPW